MTETSNLRCSVLRRLRACGFSALHDQSLAILVAFLRLIRICEQADQAQELYEGTVICRITTDLLEDPNDF